MALGMIPGGRVGRLALQPLLQVHLGVSLLLVAPCELAAALITAERLLAGVRPNVGGQVVAPGEGAHADATLKGLLTSVDADVPRQFVAAREPAVATVYGAGVGSLVNWGLAGSVRILPGLHGDQSERQSALLVYLREDLVALRRAGVVLRQLHTCSAT